ncbi:MAG: AAA family ATPase, partial [Candidatus Diapherotrites archaeon]|nr:AAA family ATPase [Candidatus Diapherotrites archaeon]
MEISNGLIQEPSKDLIYGVEGVGKTSLASTYPKPLFIDTEGSTTKHNVSRLVVTDYLTFQEAMKICVSEK